MNPSLILIIFVACDPYQQFPGYPREKVSRAETPQIGKLTPRESFPGTESRGVNLPINRILGESPREKLARGINYQQIGFSGVSARETRGGVGGGGRTELGVRGPGVG